jgi:ribosome-associated protein
MLEVDDAISIPDEEISLSRIRARGPGGQNVNKVSSAIHLRFDIRQSGALPDDVRERLLARPDRRITRDGVIIIKSARSRSQDINRQDALCRLADIIREATAAPTVRKKTRPGRKAKERRLADKSHRAKVKKDRRRIDAD